MAGQLWVKLVRKNKISRDTVEPCPDGEWQTALSAACHRLDLPMPVVVPKHERDWQTFRQIRFLPEHFLEHIPYDRMEAEWFDPDSRDTRRKSDDPRNG